MAVVSDVLLCPACMGVGLARYPERLLCERCQFAAPLNDAGFYRTARKHSEQAQSLLEQQEQNFYTNDAFRVFTVQRAMTALSSLITPLHPQCWVDVGCGTGGHALSFAGQFGTYVGLDPSDVPEGIRHSTPFPENVIRLQHDPEKPMPVADGSADLVSFIASYDHIPDRGPVLRDAWRLLKRGGHLLVAMTNYGFWLKRAVNAVSGRQSFTHSHEHFCVHTPQTLVREVTAAVPDAVLVKQQASYRHVPNLPKRATIVYRNRKLLDALDNSLSFVFSKLLAKDDLGADMMLLFRK